jgi:cell wall-associated NlpC family hydrolase
MMQQPRPGGGLRLPALAACSLAVGLAWLLAGQQLDSRPVVHLDLTAGISGTSPATSPADRHQAGPAPRAAAPQPRSPTQPTPTSPRPSTGTSTGTSPQRSTGTSQAAARAVTFAVAQVGKPYVWGTEGPRAYDCSGLVWLAWQHAGLGWARMTAADQWRWLHQHHQDVDATGLRPGDLLFYAYKPHDPASIHHVAIAIGHGRMVEAYAPGVPIRTTTIRRSGLYAAARPAATA